MTTTFAQAQDAQTKAYAYLEGMEGSVGIAFDDYDGFYVNVQWWKQPTIVSGLPKMIDGVIIIYTLIDQVTKLRLCPYCKTEVKNSDRYLEDHNDCFGD